MTKTNSGLIAYAKAQIGLPYWWGTFGQTGSASLFAAKRRQYPSYYTAGDFKYQYGKRVHDCIGLIKGYLWSESATAAPRYNSSQDKSASGMYKASKIRGSIGTFDFVPGRLIYKGKDPDHINHVGVYIGGGELIEAKGHAYGVVRGPFKPAEWTFWSQCPFIQADVEKDCDVSEAQEYRASKGSMNGIDISDIQWNKGLKAEAFEAFIDAHPEIGFYIIKCSRAASSINDSFKPWADILTRKGKLWAGYHFLNNDEKAVGAVKEADYYVNQMGPYLGKAGLAMDYENETMGFAVGEGYAKAFLDRVYELTGIRPMIYTQQSRVNKLGAIHDAGYPLWVAAYGKNAKITKFNPDQVCPGITPYSEAVIFQYSSNLYLSGYGDKLDCNVFYGDEKDWQALCTGIKVEERDMVDVNTKLPRLAQGSKGAAVKVLQTILNAEGAGLSVDGSFGPKTAAAVKEFQKKHSLAADAIVGRKTWPALMEVL